MIVKQKLVSALMMVAALTASQLLQAEVGTAGPKIEFEETEFDWGTVRQGEKVMHRFKFRNIGNAPLNIENITTSCGCTIAESSEVVAPNDYGQIDVTFSTGKRKGKKSKLIYVESNDEENQLQVLAIHGLIEEKKDTESDE